MQPRKAVIKQSIVNFLPEFEGAGDFGVKRT